jgi:chitin disaccharide deacetylase
MLRHAQNLTSQLPPGMIVNADDLAIHPSINAGILSAYRSGILSSSTMLMTTPYLDETIKSFVRPAALPIGIHLSLTLGRAVSHADQVPNLVNENGEFKLSAVHLICRSFASDLGRQLLREITTELTAQLQLACDIGLRPSHADSHQHVHANPVIFALLEDLLPRYGIDRLRYSKENLIWSAFGWDFPGLVKRRNPAKWAIINWRLNQIAPKLMVTNGFFGILYSGMINKRVLLAAITRYVPGTSMEICIHPGFPASGDAQPYGRANFNEFISSGCRQTEHDVLVDEEVRELVKVRRLVLRGFDGQPKMFASERAAL